MTTASARPRRRLSAWCSLENFKNSSGHVDPTFLLSTCRPGDQAPMIDHLSLLRTIEETNFNPKTGNLDIEFDSLTMAFAQPTPPTDRTDEERRAWRKKSEAEQKVDQKKWTFANKAQYVRDVIDHCHHVLGVQCLVGFGHMNYKGIELDKWLNLPIQLEEPLGNSPRHDAFCNKILAFCEQNFPAYDGVSFDLEGVSVVDAETTGRDPTKEPDWPLYQRALAPGGEEHERLQAVGHQETDFWTWRVTTNLTLLYRTLAEKSSSPPLRPPFSAVDRGWDRIVAFAGAGVIGALPTPGQPGVFYKSRHLQHGSDGDIARGSGPYDFVTKPGTLATAESAFRVHDYFGIRHTRNAIVRPMAYDIFKNTDVERVLDDWHTDITRYVKHSMNLHPSNFQLGVKTFPGDGQKDHHDEKGQFVQGMDGIMADPQWVKRRCEDQLAPEDLGLCLFQISSNFWAEANAGLNPTNPGAGTAAPTTRDPATGIAPPPQPIQCPLNAAAEAYYKPTRPPLKP